MAELSAEERQANEKRYVWFIAILAAFLAFFPYLFALIVGGPPGSSYIGFQYGTDDYLVYAAWMRQAMDGTFFMDNRFAIDAQPGLTVNVYFFLLGLIAKIVGIPFAMTLARIAFSILFVFLLHKLLRRFNLDLYTTKLTLTLTVFAGGLGFLFWHNYGATLTRPTLPLFNKFLMGFQPTDTWQPEGFVFPSMLTNGLFMISLCLILTVVLAFLNARHSKKHILIGALAMAVLMNIHSYDIMIVTATVIAFAAMSLVQKQVTKEWVGRALLIGTGAILPALWFMYVIKNDPVFGARADVPTTTINFRAVLFGYLPLIAFAFVAIFKRTTIPKRRKYIGLGLLFMLLSALTIYKGGDVYFMSLGIWSFAMAVALVILVLLSDESPVWNLILAWAIIGLILPYFPVAFQRKLAMGLSVPWAILASIGLASATQKLDRSTRNLTTVLALLIFCATSLRWFARENMFIRENISRTARHNVFLNPDVKNIISFLNENKETRTVVVAVPSTFIPQRTEDGRETIPDAFVTPPLPDLNPVLSGFTGVYTYAGHWGETPHYAERASDLASNLFAPSTNLEQQEEFLKRTGTDYIVAPKREAYPGAFADVTRLGEVVYDGTQFQLIKVNR